MKRSNLFGKATLCLIAISTAAFLFAGCQSSSSSGTSQTASNNTQSSTQNTNRPNAAQRKQQIQDSVQALVTAKTITQDQATKIVDALTTRPEGNGQNQSQNNQQSNQQNNGQNNNQSNGQNNGQKRQRYSPLAKLVSDGTITQAQADAVMQKIRENTPHRNNGQDSQNNSNQSSN